MMTYPERVAGPARRLDWHEMRALHFEQPDLDTFPALQLGYEVARPRRDLRGRASTGQ